MYKGYSIGSAVTNVGGDAEIEYLFNEGDVVEFRVGKTATDFKGTCNSYWFSNSYC